MICGSAAIKNRALNQKVQGLIPFVTNYARVSCQFRITDCPLLIHALGPVSLRMRMLLIIMLLLQFFKEFLYRVIVLF